MYDEHVKCKWYEQWTMIARTKAEPESITVKSRILIKGVLRINTT